MVFLSLIYKGIQMTYGMSIDYLGYKDIDKSYIQRGGTLITRKADGQVTVNMVPLGAVVSTRVRGVRWSCPQNIHLITPFSTALLKNVPSNFEIPKCSFF